MSTRLESLLASDTSTWPATVNPSPSLRDALPALIEDVEQGLYPHDPETLSRVVLALSELPAKKVEGETQAKTKMYGYVMAFDDVPDDLVRLAGRRAYKQCEWMPSPGELRKLIEPELTERRARLQRLKALAAIPERKKEDPVDREQIDALLKRIGGMRVEEK